MASSLTQRGPSRHCAGVEPEGDPGHGDEQHAGDVVVDYVAALRVEDRKGFREEWGTVLPEGRSSVSRMRMSKSPYSVLS